MDGPIEDRGKRESYLDVTSNGRSGGRNILSQESIVKDERLMSEACLNCTALSSSLSSSSFHSPS